MTIIIIAIATIAIMKILLMEAVTILIQFSFESRFSTDSIGVLHMGSGI